MFNLVRGLQAEVDSEPGLESVLRPLKERAEDVLKGLEERTTTGLAAMDLLEALAKEKEAAVAAARDSTLPLRAFGVYWALKDDAALQAAGVSAIEFTEEAQALVNRFPNAAVNADEHRRFRTSLYNPLLGVKTHERAGLLTKPWRYCWAETPMPAGNDRHEALRQRVEHWSERLHVPTPRVRVRDMIRKWGSCSTSRTITLATDLSHQEVGFQDFVIAHELLHLRVPNHGKLFKALMTAHVPDWREHDIAK